MTTVRERIERSYNEGAGTPHDFGYMFLSEYRAGNLVPADELEARIAEAVAIIRAETEKAERLRAERLCQALRYRMNASDFDQLIVAIRGGNHDG